MKTVMGTAEAARLIGFSPRRIREMLADGVLGGVRIDGKWVVTQQAIVRFLLPGGSSEGIYPGAAFRSRRTRSNACW